MMGITFRPAVRKDTQLLIGLGGPSGSGKSYSALTLATGMRDAIGGDIYGIDTENGRLAHYAEDFDFQHGQLGAPFSPEAYLDAILTARKAGARICIVDSASHMHEGEGGVLDQHEKELQRRAGDDWKKRDAANFACWIKPKAAVNRFVNSILQIDMHFIFCFRAKEKLKLVKNDRGKTEPTSMGWTPIITDRFDYEMTATLILPPGSEGRHDPRAESRKLPRMLWDIVPDDAQINRKMGRDLAEWARGDTGSKETGSKGGSAPPSRDDPPPRDPPQSERQADSRTDVLRRYSTTLQGAEEKDELAARHEGFDELRDVAIGTRETARDIYALHLQRIRGRITMANCRDEVEAMLEGAMA